MRLSNSGAVVFLSTIQFVNVIANPDALPEVDQNMLLARAPEPTAAPLLRHARDRIFARQTQDAQTCGFIDQDPDNALYCNTGYGCAYFTADFAAQYFQCCETYSTGGIDFDTATCFENAVCLPYASHSLTYSYATSSQTSGIGTEYCGSTAQYCGVTYLTADESLSGTFTHFNCESESGVFVTAWDYADTTVTSDGGSSSVTSPTSPPTTPSPTPTSPTTAPTTPATTSTPTPTHTSESKSSNTGAIAGGVVGGVAAIAIIGGLIGWLMYRKRKERKQADVPEVSVLPSK